MLSAAALGILCGRAGPGVPSRPISNILPGLCTANRQKFVLMLGEARNKYFARFSSTGMPFFREPIFPDHLFFSPDREREMRFAIAMVPRRVSGCMYRPILPRGNCHHNFLESITSLRLLPL